MGCGASSGKIQLRDPHSLALQHTLDTHTGALSDFDMNGHYLVTCGFARRHGNMQAVDRFLMVYDLRILRATSPIQCMVEPSQLRFLPSEQNHRLVVLSSAGQVQIVDMLDSEHLDIFQLDTGGNLAMSMDISPSNHCLAFGDANSCISVYGETASTEPAFNLFPRDTEFADQLPTFPHVALEDVRAVYSALPLPHLPPGETAYASDNWPSRFAREAYRPAPPVDPAILQAMKMVGTIGYAPNIGNKKRNVMEYNLKRNQDKENLDGNDPNNASSKDKDTYKSSVPKRYKKNDIKLGKMGQDEFDFDHYNKTSFCGLEASLPNSYCNAMLQVYYFTEKLRIIILNHFCSRESCLACELSFLFHMLDTGHGFPCQPANFLRALRTIPEASALGLIFSEASSMWRTSVPRLIQSWNRFLLQQVHLQCSTGEERRSSTPPPSAPLAVTSPDWSRSSPAKRSSGEPGMSKEECASISQDIADVLAGDSKAAEAAEAEDSPVAELLGMRQDKVTRCGKCRVETTTDNLLLLCNLQYPEHATLRQKTSFAQVLCASLCPEQVTPAWCERCRKYQPTTQSRRLQSLPFTLSVNAGMDNPGDLAFWSTQMSLLLEEVEGVPPPPAPGSPGKQAAPPGQKACRYGGSCTRPDCKFWHAGQQAVKEAALDVGDQLAKVHQSWVPFEVTLYLSTGGTVHPTEKECEEVVESRTYSLYAVCCTVVDPTNPEASSLVSCVQVAPSSPPPSC